MPLQELTKYNHATHIFTWREGSRDWRVYTGHSDNYIGVLVKVFSTRQAAIAFCKNQFPDLFYYKGNHK